MKGLCAHHHAGMNNFSLPENSLYPPHLMVWIVLSLPKSVSKAWQMEYSLHSFNCVSLSLPSHPHSLQLSPLSLFTHLCLIILPLLPNPHLLYHLSTNVDNVLHWALIGFHGISKGFSCHSDTEIHAFHSLVFLRSMYENESTLSFSLSEQYSIYFQLSQF